MEMPRVVESKLDTWCKEVRALDHAEGMQDACTSPKRVPSTSQSAAIEGSLQYIHEVEVPVPVPKVDGFISLTKVWPRKSQVLRMLQSQNNHSIFFAEAVSQPLLLCICRHMSSQRRLRCHSPTPRQYVSALLGVEPQWRVPPAVVPCGTATASAGLSTWGW